MAVAARLTSSGSQLVNSEFDEVSFTAGSIAFDGTSQYLSLASNTAFDQNVSFTWESWVYVTTLKTNYFWAELLNGYLNFGMNSSGQFIVDKSFVGIQITSSGTFTTNTWYYFAVSYDGTTTRMFVNGTLQGSAATGGVASGATATIGFYNTNYAACYVSNMRWVKGSALYTTAFTPPQSILPSITNTQLLLNVTDSTNFIKDNSPNKFTLTNNGAATWSAWYPYNRSPSGAIAFNGTSQYLSVADNAAFQLGTGNFTVECWVYITSSSAATKQIFDHWSTAGGSTDKYQFGINTSNRVYWQIYTENSPNSATLNVPLFTWTHLAWCRTGGNILTFINGVLKDTTGVTNSANGRNPNPTIGADETGASFFPGYITNFRMVKGTAVYTASFTPPYAPLTAISGTSLLLLAENSSTFIKDSSTNNFTLTNIGAATYFNGTPIVGPPARRMGSTGTLLVSNQFDEISFVPGSWTLSGSQGVTVGNSSVFALPGDFTVEFFFYLSSVPSTEIDFWESQTNTTFRILKRGSSSGLSYDAYGGTSYLIVSDASIPTNSWNHVAVSRTGTTVQAYFNGTRTINQTDTTSFGAPTANYSIGCRVGGTNSLAGSISNFRLITGAGMYTGATIPVPSAPLGNVTGTQLLLPTPYTGGAFFDYSTNNFTVTKVSTPTSGSVSPFTVNTPQRLTSTGILQVENDFDEVSLPAGAIAFDGVNQYLTVPGVPISATGQFTFEAWIYISRGAQTQLIYSQYTTSDPNRWTINIQTSDILTVTHGTLGNVSGTTVPIGQWQHIAVTRNASNTLTIWQDGVSSGSSAGYTSSIYQGSTRIAYYNNTPNDYFFGYISNLRVLNGTALYTATFTPPQSVLPAITNTTLLLNAIDSANFITDNSPNAYTLTNVNTAIWTPQGPYNQTPSGAIAFNGTSQYLTIADNAVFDLSTGTPNWTIECWFKTSLAGSQQILVQKDGIQGTRQNQYNLMINASNQIQGVLSPATSSTGNQNFISSVTVNTNTWYHVAMVRNANNITIFLNGVIVVGPTALSITMGNNTGPLSIGAQPNWGSYLNGYISNVRIVRGTAVYTEAFIPSNTALTTAPSTTQLLLTVSSTNNFITDSSANNFTVTNVGTATWTGYGPFNS